MKMKFVTRHIANLLYRLQYNEHCYGFYLKRFSRTASSDDDDGITRSYTLRNSDLNNGAISAPTHQQVTDWLREKHNIHIYTYLNAGKDGYCACIDYCNFRKEDAP